MDIRRGFTLGHWAVYPLDGRLVHGEQEKRIQPKAMDVLVCLAESNTTLVERDKILRQVWGERAPSDEPLTRCIGDLRRALGDTRSEHQYIQTVPKRGYRLLLPVAPLSEVAVEVASASPIPGEGNPVAARPLRVLSHLAKGASAIALLLVAVFAETLFERYLTDSDKPISAAPADATPMHSSGEDIQSIAVLPLVDLSVRRDQEYFSDGISEELINLLAQTPGLRVISRSSTFTFRERKQDIPSIASRLGASYILDGSVRKSGDQLRVTVQLIDARTNSYLYSRNYDATLQDIFAIQDSIASSVIKELKLILLEGPPSRGRVNPEAYDTYLRGRHLADKGDFASVREAQRFLEQAVNIAPDFADAWVALGNVYRFRASRGQMDQTEGRRLTREAAEKALTVNPEHPGAYVLNGHIARSFDWDWQTADADFGKAVELDRSNADALRGAASIAMTLARTGEAVKLAQQAVLLDPLGLPAMQNLAIYQFYAGDLRDAQVTVNRLIERDREQPTAHAVQSWIHIFSGKAQAGVDAAQRETEKPVRIFSEAVAYAAAGNTVASEQALERLINEHGDIWLYQIAQIYAYTGRVKDAYAWLDKAYLAKDTGLSVMLVDPFLAAIREDPRWDELLVRLDLPMEVGDGD